MGVEPGIRYLEKIPENPAVFPDLPKATWFTSAPSDDLRSFWQEQYPAMKTVDEIKTLAGRAGYTSMEIFRVLHQHGGLIIIPRQYKGDAAEAEAIISLTRQEIDLFEAYSGEYGYEFFLLNNKV